MSQTWNDTPPIKAPISLTGHLRVLRRGLPLLLLLLFCFALLLLVRLVERPFFGQNRPISPFITQFVCRTAFLLLGIRFATRGMIMKHPGGVVSNHSSWLDIFALNAAKRVYFVSKSEVANWPLIGWLARATGTVFIRRARRDAALQRAVFAERLQLGHKLMFFPEGTSTDGLRVLEFKPTLLAAFFDPALSADLWIQPATLIYRAAAGADARQYGWWGDMDFAPHLISTLAARNQGSVTIVYHAPLRVADFADRKALAKALEEVVRAELQRSGIAERR